MYTKPAENILQDNDTVYLVTNLQQEILDLQAKKVQKQENIQMMTARLIQNLDDYTKDIDTKIASNQALIDAYNEL